MKMHHIGTKGIILFRKFLVIILLLTSLSVCNSSYIGRGKASWHNYSNDRTVKKKYRNGFIAASRKYPCGTILEVWNVKNPKKKVKITIRDFGPSRRTGRILDLNKPAFKKLAPLSQGEVVVKYKVIKKGGRCVHRH